MILKTTSTQNGHTRRDRSSKIKTKIFCWMAAGMSAATLDSQAATITNLPPLAVNDVVQRNPDSRLRVRVATLLANDTDPGNDRLTLSSVSATSAAGGAVVRHAKWIAYNPPTGFTNADSFSYVITNNHGLMATGSVAITIRVDLDTAQNVVAREVLDNGDSRIQFVGIPGRLYRIQYTESLETPHWRPLGKQLADTTGNFEFTDTSATGSPARFYRSTNP